MQHHPEGRVRPGAEGAAREIRTHGRCDDRRDEARVTHVGRGRVHGVHVQAVQRHRSDAVDDHPVQPVDVQHPSVHARRPVDQGMAGRHIPPAVELQHDFFRVGERQVPVWRGLQVRYQSVCPSPGSSSGERHLGDVAFRSSTEPSALLVLQPCRPRVFCAGVFPTLAQACCAIVS